MYQSLPNRVGTASLFKSPGKLKEISGVVANCEFAHAIVEVLDRVFDMALIFEPLPEGVDVIGVEVERAGHNRLFERQVRIGESEHDLDSVAAHTRPTLC